MEVPFLDDSGLDNKYFQWKDVFLHSILEPVLTKVDTKHKFDVYCTRNSPQLVKEYGKELLARIDKNYNHMHATGLMFMVRLVRKEDIKLIKKEGFMEDAVFSVFKEDLLKAEPTVTAHFEFVDPLTLIQQNYN